MKKLSNTEAELNKALLIKKACIALGNFYCCFFFLRLCGWRVSNSIVRYIWSHKYRGVNCLKKFVRDCLIFLIFQYWFLFLFMIYWFSSVIFVFLVILGNILYVVLLSILPLVKTLRAESLIPGGTLSRRGASLNWYETRS